MILTENIENFINTFLFTEQATFSCFLSFSTKNSGPKASFIDFHKATFINFDQNSQGYVYLEGYYYLAGKSK